MELLDLMNAHLPSLGASLKEVRLLPDAASRFHEVWLEAGRQVFESYQQARIEEVEYGLSGSRQIRRKTLHTPLGSITLARRAFDTPSGTQLPADKALGIPEDAWLPEVLELACALGISSEFPNAHRLFTRWSHVEITERTLANQVEATGEKLQALEAARPPLETSGPDSALTKVVAFAKKKPRVYVGMDGILTPLNAQQGYKEALVGVIFQEAAHRQISPKRSEIRQKDYVATITGRKAFARRLNQLYSEAVGMTPHEVVVLGDGAKWIWEMAAEYFPERIEILDFFHVSEYVWEAARACLPEDARRGWVEAQQALLKESKWEQVREGAATLPRPHDEAKQAVRNLRRYLKNNATRIDYKRYLELGLMIGSGVVESSNRRVVAQRLKQAGMHWSKGGADAVMGLRACYLSDSNRWQRYWTSHAA